MEAQGGSVSLMELRMRHQGSGNPQKRQLSLALIINIIIITINWIELLILFHRKLMSRQGYPSVLFSLHLKADFEMSTWKQLFIWETVPGYTSKSKRGKWGREAWEAPEGHVSERITAVDSGINPTWIHWGTMWNAPQKCPTKACVKMDFLFTDICPSLVEG